MRLQEKYFNLVQQGKKTIELRLFDEKRQLIRVGDVIEFCFAERPEIRCLKTVISIYRAQNFEQLCFMIDVYRAGFENAEELIKEVSKFYSLEEQSKYGVIAIELD